jgi:hypothetical protein
MVTQILSILAALGLLGSGAASSLDKLVNKRNDKVTPASKSAVALRFQNGRCCGQGGTDGQPSPPTTPVPLPHQ